MCREGQGTAGDEPGPAGRGRKARPPLVGRDRLELMALAVAQRLDTRALVELVLESVEIEATGVGRGTNADPVILEHLDAGPVALIQ